MHVHGLGETGHYVQTRVQGVHLHSARPEAARPDVPPGRVPVSRCFPFIGLVVCGFKLPYQRYPPRPLSGPRGAFFSCSSAHSCGVGIITLSLSRFLSVRFAVGHHLPPVMLPEYPFTCYKTAPARGQRSCSANPVQDQCSRLGVQGAATPPE